MIPESNKKLVMSLLEMSSQIQDNALLIAESIPRPENLVQEDIDNAIVNCSRLLGVYQNFPWNNTEKYKRVMEILLEEELD
jgi:hypothetical protein